ncbi:MAG: hypothetical protein KAT71_05275, partial [Gammaproteobacteria bacterium]|nr:hypothetical protein [Gammaproteobacteria bacterium]
MPKYTVFSTNNHTPLSISPKRFRPGLNFNLQTIAIFNDPDGSIVTQMRNAIKTNPTLNQNLNISSKLDIARLIRQAEKAAESKRLGITQNECLDPDDLPALTNAAFPEVTISASAIYDHTNYEAVIEALKTIDHTMAAQLIFAFEHRYTDRYNQAYAATNECCVNAIGDPPFFTASTANVSGDKKPIQIGHYLAADKERYPVLNNLCNIIDSAFILEEKDGCIIVKLPKALYENPASILEKLQSSTHSL